MKRKLVDKLIEWKDKKKNSNHKPILITGVRGVGKTYLAYDFVRSFYKDCIYLNFERNGQIGKLFQDEDPEIIIKNISEYFKKSVKEKATILIFDEIAGCSKVINFIMNATKSKIPINIIIISSMPLEYIDSSQKIGKLVDHLILYPFNFEEYLWATGNDWYSDLIREHFISNKKVPDIVHKELMGIFEQYLIIGGMPRSINEYINLETEINISEQHKSILDSFYLDTRNHMDDSLCVKAKSIMNTIDMQIEKKNKKFQYKLIRKGASKKLYIDAINYMDQSNMVIKVKKLDSDQFKLFLCDVGLQLSMFYERKISPNTQTDLELRRGIIENYIAQNLISNHHELNFWESNAQAKIDFIIKKDMNLLPIEVSIDDNTRSKSLSVFKTTYDIKNSIKISTNNFGLKNNIKYIPYYAVFCIE